MGSNTKPSSLTTEKENSLLKRLSGWSISRVGMHSIKKTFVFKNFLEAIGFVNKIADLAEEMQHHPDISISYNRVTLKLSTHDVKGLSEKDFSLAEKINTIGK